MKVINAKQVMRNYLKIIFILIFPQSKDLFFLNFLAPVPAIKLEIKSKLCASNIQKKMHKGKHDVLPRSEDLAMKYASPQNYSVDKSGKYP